MTTSQSLELFPRSAGILLHPTSLPGRYGIGDLGSEAHAFVRFLADCKQSVWQMLPIGPTGFADSPYQSSSSFAGNPLLIGIDRLVERGYLPESIRGRLPDFSAEVVDFERVIPWKHELLAKAYAGFCNAATASDRADFERYCREQAGWLDDFSLFSALKAPEPSVSWMDWEPGLAKRDPAALAAARSRLHESMRRVQFEQFEFERQWRELATACKAANVRLMGDMPIYVSQDSADAWSHRELFKFDGQGRPTVVAGVPPDYFSKTGQLWGNPIYDWPAHEQNGFRWWIERFRAAFSRFELLRVDHFRGFEAFWEVPAGAETAVDGEWVKAPGERLFSAVQDALGNLPIVAENLGLITPEVEALRRQFGFPGMVVLQFGFDSDEPGALEFRPENYSADAVAYTGTHDNDTLVGWLYGPGDARARTAAQLQQERARIAKYFGEDSADLPRRIIESLLESKARLAILPLQDVLGVDGSGRMNRPSVTDGNWRWRCSVDQLANAPTTWLAGVILRSGRVRQQ